MPSTPAADLPPRSHNRGVFVVVLLALIFFALMAALLFFPSKGKREPSLVSGTLFVVPPQMRLRTEPNGKAPVIATLLRGSEVKLLEDEGAWVRVESSDGVSGWAERNLLAASAEHERHAARVAAIRKLPPLEGISDKKTPLYAGPGIFYPVSGELPRGARVKVYTRDHDFYAIDVDGDIAYVDVDAINVTASEGTPRLEVAAAKAERREVTGSSSSREQRERDQALPFPEAPSAASPFEAVPPAPSRASGVYAAVPAGGRDPQVLDRVMPDYPRMARSAGVEGTVLIRGIVRRNGRIDEVEIVKNLPYGLGEAARRAVTKWEFKPATYQGDAIDVYYTVTVNFKLAS